MGLLERNTKITVDYPRESQTIADNLRQSLSIAFKAFNRQSSYFRQLLQILQTLRIAGFAGIRRIIPGPLSCGSDSYALSVHDTELS